jgi:predicted RNase H-like nuclease (RuvC/YqgF family)
MEFTSNQTSLLIKMFFDKLESNKHCMELDEEQINALHDALEESREEVASLKKELASIKKEAKKAVKPPKKATPAPMKRGPGRPKKVVK